MPNATRISTPARFVGCLVGLAVGDAVGAAVEFKPRGSFTPVTDMIGGGPWSLAPGQWTDDTSMALCLGESLVTCRGFDAVDQVQRYVRWYRDGHWSSKGDCFDIGTTTRAALTRFEANGDPFAGSSDANTAGNGSLMRLAPAPMAAWPIAALADQWAADSSRTTHGAPAAVESCRVYAAILHAALNGEDRETLLGAGACLVLTHDGVRAAAQGAWRAKSVESIRGSGYVVESLEAALWCFAQTTSYRDAVLAAANLGDDADTTAAITGQLAGAFYGVDAIPAAWRTQLTRGTEIEDMALELFSMQHPPDFVA